MTSESLTIREEDLRQLLDACLLWCEDRALDPADVPAKYLKAMIVQVFPEIVVTKESCGCDGGCDECPTEEQVLRSIDEVKREAQQYIQIRAALMVPPEKED